ncbi:hypothetical protein GE09DRAFT_147901 [Coniochaeta sp. 2T2.1]|nr:hypothetical protein GE09DRAFT_147901 [Coniochaeta sp. 2T2.1]
MSLTWAINDWDKQDNQWGNQGLVYTLPETAPLKDQLRQAEDWVSQFESLAEKNKAQAKKKSFFGPTGKDEAKYRYKARIARDHVAAIKKKMEHQAAAAKPKPPPAPVAKPPATPVTKPPVPVAKQPAPPAKPVLNADAIKDAAFGTEKQQAAAERTDNQKEAFDLGVKGIGMGKDTKDLVKALRTPIKDINKGAGLVEARDTAGFGELQQIVKFALAKTPKEAYEVALARREIYLRVNVVNEAAAKIVDIESYFPPSFGRRTTLPEMGPFTMRPIDPRNKQGTFALLGGASGDGILRKIVTQGRFIRAGIAFCAETPDKKAHMDFSVGFDWEPGVSLVTQGVGGVSVLEGKKCQEAFQKAKGNQEATLTNGQLTVLVAINGQNVVIAVGRNNK